MDLANKGRRAAVAAMGRDGVKIVNKALREEYRRAGLCEYCLRPCRVCEGAHLFAKGIGEGGAIDLPINLIKLGSSAISHVTGCYCHHESHCDGNELNKKFLEIVAAREATTVDDIKAVIHMLRWLVKPTLADLEAGLAQLSTSARKLGVAQLESAGVM